MEAWDSNYIDMEEPGHFSIDDEQGYFVFGLVRGQLDVRRLNRGTRLEFSWEGQCEFDEMSGRGWLELKDERSAEGRIFIHLGDESGFLLEKT